MRAMLKGDQAFFYHSNCKVPGIAGIMEIVEEHTPDSKSLYSNVSSHTFTPFYLAMNILYKAEGQLYHFQVVLLIHI